MMHSFVYSTWHMVCVLFLSAIWCQLVLSDHHDDGKETNGVLDRYNNRNYNNNVYTHAHRKSNNNNNNNIPRLYERRKRSLADTNTVAKNTSRVSNDLHDPDLPFGDINVIALTDVHSWIGGHEYKEPNLNVDYGHVLSFYERLKEHCNAKGKDLWFVENGDWNDGTGLVMNGDPSYIEPLIQKMPWDAVNTGNHELYRNPVIQYMTRPGGFVDWWGDKFLTSNIVHADTQEPFGAKYRVLHGKQSNVLTFGFLYNMDNHAEGLVAVKHVETVVNEKWFENALKQEQYDAILVLAHMDHEDALVNVILTKIRDAVGKDMPVQFITGHTHIRQYDLTDRSSASFEAGRYLDTIGFVSFPTKSSLQSILSNPNATNPFKHRFLDANIDVLAQTLGVETLQTDNGQALSNFIHRTQRELGLEDEVGCIDESYYLNRSLFEKDSVWRFFADEVVPTQFEKRHALFVNQGDFRYDLLGGGVMRVDDIIAVSPFNDTYLALDGIPGQVLWQLNNTMNQEVVGFFDILPEFILVSPQPVTNQSNYTLVIHPFTWKNISQELTAIYPEAAEITPYKTKQTATQIWLDHVREHCPCGYWQHGSSGSSSGKSHKPAVSFRNGSATSIDLARVWLAVAAIFVVFALAAVYVRQRGIIYRRERDQVEFETLEAMRELDEEGEFV